MNTPRRARPLADPLRINAQTEARDLTSDRGPQLYWLGFWLLAVAAAAVIGATATPDAWYAQLRKPSFNPPAAVFGPVWTILYLVMAVAAWRVARQPGVPRERRNIALLLMGIQLVLNALWSPLFFGMHSPAWAFVDICALWLAVGATILAFSSVNSVAAWIMVPYLAWVSFALLLNGSIWLMNR